jgi:hypothetical protein
VRVRRDNSITEITRIIFSFVSDRVIAAVRQTKKPKEAGCIACDRNEEKECVHLQPMSRRKALDSRFKAAIEDGNSGRRREPRFQTRMFRRQRVQTTRTRLPVEATPEAAKGTVGPISA